MWEEIIRTGDLDDALAMLTQDAPDGEFLEAMTRVLGEDHHVPLDEGAGLAYIAGPAWRESSTKPGEGECDTYTVDRMLPREVLAVPLIAEAIGQASANPDQHRALVEEVARVQAAAARESPGGA
ncbi:hypothetical protein [Nonomuraea sp. NPDC049400]|uniref:hypothetical protein n=1 Tax=Nonomuraea sp. NPDC049400 TaxID=3364352 RepID=UPI0037BDEAAA